MTADQSESYLNIKGIRVRKIKITNKSFEMDVFGAGQRGVPVCHVAESQEFIFLVNGLSATWQLDKYTSAGYRTDSNACYKIPSWNVPRKKIFRREKEGLLKK